MGKTKFFELNHPIRLHEVLMLALFMDPEESPICAIERRAETCWCFLRDSSHLTHFELRECRSRDSLDLQGSKPQGLYLGQVSTVNKHWQVIEVREEQENLRPNGWNV